MDFSFKTFASGKSAFSNGGDFHTAPFVYIDWNRSDIVTFKATTMIGISLYTIDVKTDKVIIDQVITGGVIDTYTPSGNVPAISGLNLYALLLSLFSTNFLTA